MPRLHETAYPRLKTAVTEEELHGIYTRKAEEEAFATDQTRSAPTQVGLLGKRSSQGVLPSERETSEKRDKRWSSQDDRKHSLYRGGHYVGERERTCPAEGYGLAGDYRAVSAKRDGDAGVLYTVRTDATDL